MNNLYKYQIDCESAMNTLLDHLKETEPVFTIEDVLEAFKSLDSNEHYRHLISALKHNSEARNNIHELLDKACACDLLVEYEGKYIAIDWTDSLEEMVHKKDKHKWLNPLYALLGIDYTVVAKAYGYSKIRTKSHEMVARIKASNTVLEHIANCIEKGKVNSSLEFDIKVKF